MMMVSFNQNYTQMMTTIYSLTLFLFFLGCTGMSLKAIATPAPEVAIAYSGLAVSSGKALIDFLDKKLDDDDEGDDDDLNRHPESAQ
jgi:hypothetical protein